MGVWESPPQFADVETVGDLEFYFDELETWRVRSAASDIVLIYRARLKHAGRTQTAVLCVNNRMNLPSLSAIFSAICYFGNVVMTLADFKQQDLAKRIIFEGVQTNTIETGAGGRKKSHNLPILNLRKHPVYRALPFTNQVPTRRFVLHPLSRKNFYKNFVCSRPLSLHSTNFQVEQGARPWRRTHSIVREVQRTHSIVREEQARSAEGGAWGAVSIPFPERRTVSLTHIQTRIPKPHTRPTFFQIAGTTSNHSCRQKTCWRGGRLDRTSVQRGFRVPRGGRAGERHGRGKNGFGIARKHIGERSVPASRQKGDRVRSLGGRGDLSDGIGACT